MIVTRLSLPGQSAPGPDPGRPWRQRAETHHRSERQLQRICATAGNDPPYRNLSSGRCVWQLTFLGGGGQIARGSAAAAGIEGSDDHRWRDHRSRGRRPDAA